MHARLLAAFLLLLIGYGSMFPFDYVPHQTGWGDLHHLLGAWPARLSAADVAGNVLLFVPLGAVVPSLSKHPLGQLGWIAGAVVLAWLLQYLQFWYPSRDPSGSDAVFNTVGLLLGVAFAFASRKVFAAHGLRTNLDSPLWPVAALLMLLWLGYRWFPWVPTFDVANLRGALRPLAHGMSWLDAPRALHDAAAWTLWFWLARHGPLGRLSSGRGQAVACAMLILMMEPLFLGNSVSPANGVGLAAAIGLRRWLAADDAPSRWRLLLLLAVSVAASGLAPYRFDATAEHKFLWLPFAGMLSGSMVMNTASLIEKCYLYGGMVVVLTAAGARWWSAGLAVAVELACIEWLQMSIPGRTAEITDPLLALLIAVAFRPVFAPRSASHGSSRSMDFSHKNAAPPASSNRIQLHE